jgi:NADPH-dependent curcumin reductase CurA
MHAREIRLASRPTGMPVAENFELAVVEVPKPRDDEVLVRNTLMSVDPYMRGRMNDAPSYVPPFQIGKALSGGAIGVVESSRDPALAPGTTVLHNLGWREYAVGPAKGFTPIDTTLAPAGAYLGVLGMTGMTAWVGTTLIGRVEAGGTVLISSAAGAVGTVAGALAKHRGAHVIGTTRSIESAQKLRDLGFDEAIVVEPGSFGRQLRVAAPEGIDFYFDNVGGEQLEAAIFALRDFGTIAMCGMIAGYNEAVPGPRNLAMVVGKRLTMRGFIVSDHTEDQPRFLREVAPLVASGAVRNMESVVSGLENAPAAFVSLFAPGAHVGKLLVRISPD